MRITDKKGIAPTNYKKGTLFLRKYRPIDLSIMVCAFVWSFTWLILMFFVFVPNLYFFMFFVVLIPAFAISIVQPMQHYHNYLEYILLLMKWNKRNKHYSNILIKKETKTSNKRKKSKLRKG